MNSKHSKDSQKSQNIKDNSVSADYNHELYQSVGNVKLDNDSKKNVDNHVNNGGLLKNDLNSNLENDALGNDVKSHSSLRGRFGGLGRFAAFVGGVRSAKGGTKNNAHSSANENLASGKIGLHGHSAGSGVSVLSRKSSVSGSGDRSSGSFFGFLDGVSSWVSCRSYRFSIVNSVLFVGLLGWFGNNVVFCVACGFLFVCMVTFIKLQCWLNVLFVACRVIDVRPSESSHEIKRDSIVDDACAAFDCCRCCGNSDCACDYIDDIRSCDYNVGNLIEMYKKHSLRDIISTVVYVVKNLTAQYLYGWFVVAAIIVSSCFMVVFGCALMYSQIYVSYSYAFGVFLVAMQFAILSFTAIHLAKNKGDARGFLDIYLDCDDICGLDGSDSFNNCDGGKSIVGKSVRGKSVVGNDFAGKSSVGKGFAGKSASRKSTSGKSGAIKSDGIVGFVDVDLNRGHKVENEIDAKHYKPIKLHENESAGAGESGKSSKNIGESHKNIGDVSNGHKIEGHNVVHEKHMHAESSHDMGNHDKHMHDRENRHKHTHDHSEHGSHGSHKNLAHNGDNHSSGGNNAKHERDVKDEKRGKYRNSSYDIDDLIGLGLHENRNKL